LKKLCYIRGISKGGSVIYEGSETGNTYRFFFNDPCLKIVPSPSNGQSIGEREVDERDIYELLQKVKVQRGSCGGCGGGGSKKAVTYPVFALRNF